MDSRFTRALNRMDRAVEAGAAVLDREYGIRWVDNVNLDTLDLGDPTACVLGQVYGTYSNGLSRLFGLMWRAQAKAHGFYVYEVSRGPGYEVLTSKWREAILARRAAIALRASKETPMRVERTPVHA